MSESVEMLREPAGTRVHLPCGHQWTMPWGVPPEAAMADLLRHQSQCDLDPSRNGLYPRLREPGTLPQPIEAGP